MAIEKVISLPRPTLKEVAHEQSWQLHNVEALLAGLMSLTDELPQELDVKWQIECLIGMTKQKVEAVVGALDPYI